MGVAGWIQVSRSVGGQASLHSDFNLPQPKENLHPDQAAHSDESVSSNFWMETWIVSGEARLEKLGVSIVALEVFRVLYPVLRRCVLLTAAAAAAAAAAVVDPGVAQATDRPPSS